MLSRIKCRIARTHENAADWVAWSRTGRLVSRWGLYIALLALLGATMPVLSRAQTQPAYSPVIIQAPQVDTVDENHVSVMTGKLHFSIPALSLGDVSFAPTTVAGLHFEYGGMIADNNMGYIEMCKPATGYPAYGGVFTCTSPSAAPSLQVIHGEERAIFVLNTTTGVYTPASSDGSGFTDNGNGTCTWTKRDGAQIIYVGFHVSGNPLCQSNNISKINYPDGRILTYYYYGSFSTANVNGQSPILSIASNAGYLLKYNYSSTPTFGGESSVTAINRAYESCDPAAPSCTLTHAWPTATFSWQLKTMSVSDDFKSLGIGYNPYQHYIFTITDQGARNYVFELDSYTRVISYQPPQATVPLYFYSLCSLLSDGNTLRNCFGRATWNWAQSPPDPTADTVPPLFDMVSSSTRNGQTWTYGFSTMLRGYPAPAEWTHGIQSPQGPGMSAWGNATPGTEVAYQLGPVARVTAYDGTVYGYEGSWRNYVSSMTTPLGKRTSYKYDGRGNLQTVTETPYSVSGSSASTITRSATYPDSCGFIVSCNKPTAVVDGNNNQTDYTYYDTTHGGVKTMTAPAVNGVRPQTRYFYAQRRAWYRNTGGTMTPEANYIWVLTSTSVCKTGAASGDGCANPGDEIRTTYDYGPDSGPNNLLLRGVVVDDGGLSLRTCYTYDMYSRKISETKPRAGLGSCS
ncbi:hypothetical protein [Azospirillum sp. B4]|uniref:hypothetical protein n=1 Tax=Azospirillum sp. B4 TaxID=95605 RepID=UPI00034DDB6C|nr:hypothetical protein [Azospirillum sp. B4]